MSVTTIVCVSKLLPEDDLVCTTPFLFVCLFAFSVEGRGVFVDETSLRMSSF